MDRKRTLREINNDILELTDAALDADCTEELESGLSNLEIERDEKIENIAYLRLEQKAEVQALDDEIRRLQSRKRAIENQGRWLDSYCVAEMLRAGIKLVVGKFVKLAVRKSPVSFTHADDITELDPEFVTEEITYKVSKSDVARHFKATGEIPRGFEIVDNKHHIRIT